MSGELLGAAVGAVVGVLATTLVGGWRRRRPSRSSSGDAVWQAPVGVPAYP